MGLASPREQKAQEQAAHATRGMSIPKIKDISVIECQPAGVRLTVVKITTDQVDQIDSKHVTYELSFKTDTGSTPICASAAIHQHSVPVN